MDVIQRRKHKRVNTALINSSGNPFGDDKSRQEKTISHRKSETELEYSYDDSGCQFDSPDKTLDNILKNNNRDSVINTTGTIKNITDTWNYEKQQTAIYSPIEENTVSQMQGLTSVQEGSNTISQNEENEQLMDANDLRTSAEENQNRITAIKTSHQAQSIYIHLNLTIIIYLIIRFSAKLLFQASE